MGPNQPSWSRVGVLAGAVQTVDYEASLKAKMRIAGQLFELQGAEVLASEGFSRDFQENKVGAPGSQPARSTQLVPPCPQGHTKPRW